MTRCAASLIIREMQIHFTNKIMRVDEDVEKSELLYTARGDAKLWSHCEKQHDGS